MSGPGKANRNNRKTSRRHPSPPTSNVHELQPDTQLMRQQQNAALQHQFDTYAYNLQRLQAHNPGAQYENANTADNRSYINSLSNTAFSSPEQRQAQIIQYDIPDFPGAYHNPYNLGVGIPYDEYGTAIYEPTNGYDYPRYPAIQHPQYEQQHGSAYYTHPRMQQPQYPAPAGYYANSPPTPAASDQSGGEKRTKGNRRPIAPIEPTVTPKGSPHDVPRSGRARRHRASEKPAKRGKTSKGKQEVPPLTAPLSELTKSYDQIPIKDMDAWVNRPVEERLKECRKKDGYIPRPMNSFMMYRSAYAERTKHWCLQNNHQVVSLVSGQSWPLEPPEIKDLYTEYARQERENHAKAHPKYKFSPSKSDSSRRKRKGATDDPDDESVDLGGPDDGWKPSKSAKNMKGKGRAKKTKVPPYNSKYPVHPEWRDEYEAHSPGEPSVTEKSSFQFNNPGKDCPPELGSLQYGEYYQTVVNSNPLGSTRVEDITLRKAEVPQSHYDYAQPLVGLPGGQHYELLQQQQSENERMIKQDPEVAVPLDPQLDSLYSDFDLDQLGTLDSSLSQLIFQDLNQSGIFGSLGADAAGRQPNGNQEGYQNDVENRYQNSPRNSHPNEYQSGYENVQRDVYENEYPDEDHDESSTGHQNAAKNAPNPEADATEPRTKPEKLDHKPSNE